MKYNKLLVCLNALVFVFISGLSYAGQYDYRPGVQTFKNPIAEESKKCHGNGCWRFSLPFGNTKRHRYAITTVDNSFAPVYSGNKALRFEVKGNYKLGCAIPSNPNEKQPNGDPSHSDCGHGSARAEVTRNWNVLERPGDNKWYQWNIFIPEHIVADEPDNSIVGQFHQQYCEGSPPVLLTFTRQNRIELMHIKYKGAHNAGSAVVSKGKWHQIRMHMKWSTGSNGLTQYWMDGNLIANIKGPNLRATGKNGLACGPVYSKFGVYRPTANRSNRGIVMYYDDLREGRSLQNMLKARDAWWNITGEKSSNNNNNDNSSTGKKTTYAQYVKKNADLFAAFNRYTGSKSIAEWGKWHWKKWGHKENRAVVPGNNGSAALMPSATAPIQNVKLADLADADRGGQRFSMLMSPDIVMLNDSVVNNNNIFSFEDYKIIDSKHKDGGMVLGFRQSADDSFDTINNTIGYRAGNTTVLYTYDDTLFGYNSNGLMSVRNAETSYVNLRHAVNVDNSNWKLNGAVTYGRGTGTGHENSFIMDVNTVHAFGFDAQAKYKWNENDSTIFSIAQPLRIESGKMKIMGIQRVASADLKPNGREIMFGVKHQHKFNDSQFLVSSFNYTDNIHHYDGFDNASVMFNYKYMF